MYNTECYSCNLGVEDSSNFKKKAWLNRWLAESPEKEEKMEMEMDTCCPDCKDESQEDVDTHTVYNTTKSSEDEYVDVVSLKENKKRKRVQSPSKFSTEEEGFSGDAYKLPHKKRKLSFSEKVFVKAEEHEKNSEKKVNFQAVVGQEEVDDDETEDEDSVNEEGPHGNVEESVQQVLAKTGVSPESIIKLINNKEERAAIIQKTGFSNNYIMKLQRKVLRSSRALQLREPSVHAVGNVQVHVLFDNNQDPLFIKKELCQVLDMKGTTFSYWKKKAKIKEIDTSQSFRLMDKCRAIFGGRSTYTLYRVEDTLKILASMESSRQRNYFRNLMQLKDLALRYSEKQMMEEVEENEEMEEIEEEENVDMKSPESDCQE